MNDEQLAKIYEIFISYIDLMQNLRHREMLLHTSFGKYMAYSQLADKFINEVKEILLNEEAPGVSLKGKRFKIKVAPKSEHDIIMDEWSKLITDKI